MKIISEFKKAKNIKNITKADLKLVVIYMALVAIGLVVANYFGGSTVCLVV